jgi:hypothetical protein
MRLKEFLLAEKLDAKAYAAWKQTMKSKGAVTFEPVELDSVLAQDKDGKYLGSFDKQRNVAEAAAKPGDDDYDGNEDDGEYINFFYIVGWNDEEEKAWLGIVKKDQDSGRWVESSSQGEPPSDWGGKRYMSYLSPDDVMSWLRKDYDEIAGPFFDKEEAIEHAEHQFGPLGK